MESGSHRAANGVTLDHAVGLHPVHHRNDLDDVHGDAGRRVGGAAYTGIVSSSQPRSMVIVTSVSSPMFEMRKDLPLILP